MVFNLSWIKTAQRYDIYYKHVIIKSLFIEFSTAHFLILSEIKVRLLC